MNTLKIIFQTILISCIVLELAICVMAKAKVRPYVTSGGRSTPWGRKHRSGYECAQLNGQCYLVSPQGLHQTSKENDCGKGKHYTVHNIMRWTTQIKKWLDLMQHKIVRSIRRLDSKVNTLRIKSCNSGSTGPSKGEELPKNSTEKDSDHCPKDFFGVATWRVSCYRFSNYNATWNDAAEYCSSMNGKLISIETSKEFWFTKFLLKTKGLDQAEDIDSWWTRGKYVSAWHKWVWYDYVPPMKPFHLTKWHNNITPHPKEGGKQCMITRKQDYFWENRHCSELHHFICEVKPKISFY